MAQNRDSSGYVLSQKMRYLEKHCNDNILTWIKEKLQPAIRQTTERVEFLSINLGRYEVMKKRNRTLSWQNWKLKEKIRELAKPSVRQATLIRQARAEYRLEKRKIKETLQSEN